MPDDQTSLNEFSKFVRYFTTRVVQSVVQARLGIRIEQKCVPSPDQCDWFNTRVDELGEIAAHLRSSLIKCPPATPSITLEFLLYTSDCQFLPLETWEIAVDNEVDPNVSVKADLYHQLGTLLRSIIGAARVTPMYRYFVRKQGDDSFVILYRVYEGSPCTDLGEKSKKFNLAYLPSPHGALSVILSYRTQMELPHKLEPVTKEIDKPDPPSNLILPEAEGKERIVARPSFSDAIPVAGGYSEPFSPMTDQHFPLFGNSPAQSECSIGPSSAPKTRFRLGRSTSSEESGVCSDNHITQELSVETKTPAVTLPPIRLHDGHSDKQMRHSSSLSRLRNNSFPFASLLTQAMSSSTGFHRSKRNSVCLSPSETVIEERHSERSDTSPPHLDDVINENDAESDESQKAAGSSGGVLKDDATGSFLHESTGSDEALDRMECSDESFVKVFAFGSRENLGSDLGELLKEFRLAPYQLREPIQEDSANLQEDIQRFSKFAPNFDDFVRAVSEQPVD